MTPDEVFEDIAGAKPAAEEMIYLARTGDDFAWRSIAPGEPMGTSPEGSFPDAWIFNAVSWPTGADLEDQRAFFNDLLEEMESSFGGADRCRWAMDDPYPHRH